MNNINFDPKNYQSFNDYNDLMIRAFKITCSLCDSQEIEFLFKDSPIPIGRLLKQQNLKLSDIEVEQIVKQELIKWDQLEASNFKQKIPTFLCAICWNSLLENSTKQDS
ncbi:hypothetical protein [Mycoplasma putrefaciens]|nr:hypothetical protein [Mycoplasma putrefaciens]